VIDSTPTFVEHPEVIAERLENVARQSRSAPASCRTDCGFETIAGRGRVARTWCGRSSIDGEGAKLASSRLFLGVKQEVGRIKVNYQTKPRGRRARASLMTGPALAVDWISIITSPRRCSRLARREAAQRTNGEGHNGELKARRILSGTLADSRRQHHGGGWPIRGALATICSTPANIPIAAFRACPARSFL